MVESLSAEDISDGDVSRVVYLSMFGRGGGSRGILEIVVLEVTVVL